MKFKKEEMKYELRLTKDYLVHVNSSGLSLTS